MGNVRLLSETVSNQIAAGEVVERPASVVKELIENALDAGATRISVEIQAGGRSLIRVTDNGVGMNRDDALLCLERHATSKIQSADDLASIATMGFRGEAIPSIASVGRMTLTTLSRENESGEGTRIEIHGGKIRQVESAGHAAGTTVEIRSLFYNLPARRKFLRTPETERSHSAFPDACGVGPTRRSASCLHRTSAVSGSWRRVRWTIQLSHSLPQCANGWESFTGRD